MHAARLSSAFEVDTYWLDHASVYELIKVTISELIQVTIFFITLEKTFSDPHPYQSIPANFMIF
jgi:hypothetical protein